MAYPETWATMTDLISQKLQDTGNAKWADAEIALGMTEGLREISNTRPFIYRAEFNLESRNGRTTATTASALVDSTKSQFLAGDVGKWLYNSTDRTWAVVTAYVSATQLTLSKDIMAVSEDYRIFNKECTDSKEININANQLPDDALGSRAMDWLYIDKIEYPIMQDPPSYLLPGQWELQENNIIRLKIDSQPPDSSVADAPDEVWVYFAMEHRLSRMTDLMGDTASSAAAGVTTLTVHALTDTDVVYKGQLFTVDNIKGTYVADYQRAIASSSCAISFWPPLASAAASTIIVRFISNTMPQKLEGIYADLVAGKIAMNKAQSYVNKVNYGASPFNIMHQWGQYKYEKAVMELKGLTGDVAPCAILL
jgi:hypothetical protein